MSDKTSLKRLYRVMRYAHLSPNHLDDVLKFAPTVKILN